MPITVNNGTLPEVPQQDLSAQQLMAPPGDAWQLVAAQMIQQQMTQNQGILQSQLQSRAPDPGLMGFSMGQAGVLPLISALANRPLVESQLQSQQAQQLLETLGAVADLQNKRAKTAETLKKTGMMNRKMDLEEHKAELTAENNKIARQLQMLGVEASQARAMAAQMGVQLRERQVQLEEEAQPYKLGLEISPLEEMKMKLELQKQAHEEAMDTLKAKLDELQIEDRQSRTAIEQVRLELERSRNDRATQEEEREQLLFNETIRKAQAYDEQLARILEVAKAMAPEERDDYLTNPQVMAVLNEKTGLRLSPQGWIRRIAGMVGDALSNALGRDGMPEPAPGPTLAPTPTSDIENKLIEKLRGR